MDMLVQYIFLILCRTRVVIFRVFRLQRPLDGLSHKVDETRVLKFNICLDVNKQESTLEKMNNVNNVSYRYNVWTLN